MRRRSKRSNYLAQADANICRCHKQDSQHVSGFENEVFVSMQGFRAGAESLEAEGVPQGVQHAWSKAFLPEAFYNKRVSTCVAAL